MNYLNVIREDMITRPFILQEGAKTWEVFDKRWVTALKKFCSLRERWIRRYPTKTLRSQSACSQIKFLSGLCVFVGTNATVYDPFDKTG